MVIIDYGSRTYINLATWSEFTLNISSINKRKNKGAEWAARKLEFVIARTARFCKINILFILVTYVDDQAILQ